MRHNLVFLAIFVQRDDRPGAVVDLLFVTMGRVLDLAALITMFDRGNDAAELLDLPEFLQHRFLHRALDRLHSGRTAQHVHGVFKDAGLIEQDGLAVRGETNPFFARGGERLVRTVGMAGVGAVHVGEHELGGGSR